MPELPEVETLCRQLRRSIRGREIIAANVFDQKLAGLKNPAGRRVTDVQRMGKMLEISLDNGEAIYIHLRMTGRLLRQKDCAMPAHTRWQMAFAEGTILLIDPRRFATVRIAAKKQADGTLDIFQNFNLAAFLQKHGNRKTNVKMILMDQTAVAGIGNIYACEILHSTGITPQRLPASLKRNDWEKIFASARQILLKAIACRGTSISDWRDLRGKKGENQKELQVYGREGQPCSRCGAIICRIKQNGRSTFFCPSCQK